MNMNRTLSGFLAWSIAITVVCVAIYVNVDTYTNMLFYPRSPSDIWMMAILGVSLPCSFVSIMTFLLTTSTRPNFRTGLALVTLALLTYTILFAGWLALPYKVDLRGYEILGMVLTVLYFFCFCLLFSALSLAPRLWPWKARKSRPLGKWWGASGWVLGLTVTFIVSSIVFGHLDKIIANFAVSLGGHYYSWLNFIPPAIFSAITLAGAAQVGLYWAAFNDAQYKI